MGAAWPPLSLSPQSPIFEVLSGQGTLSLGPSLSSAHSAGLSRFLWTLLAEGRAEEEVEEV